MRLNHLSIKCSLSPRSFILSFFFFSSRRRHTRCLSDWSSDVCSSDLRISREEEVHHHWVSPAGPPGELTNALNPSHPSYDGFLGSRNSPVEQSTASHPLDSVSFSSGRMGSPVPWTCRITVLADATPSSANSISKSFP